MAKDGEEEVRIEGGPMDNTGNPDSMNTAEGDETPDEAAETVKITMNGQEFDVPADVAHAYAADKTGFEKSLQTLANNSANQSDPVTEPSDDIDDLATILFEDPNKAVSMIQEKIRKEVTADLTSAYNSDKNADKFWDGFYNDNPDLKQDDFLVKAVLAEHANDIGDLPVAKAAERLAELTQAQIVRYGGSTSKSKTKRTATAQPSGPSGKKQPRSEEETDNVRSISDVLRERRANRNKKSA